MKKTACPVCNGLTTLIADCPKCHHSLNDNGRYLDHFGDYSPYRPIDDLKQTDGLIDLKTHQCPHIVNCTNCCYKGIYLVSES